jgi:putative ABC transport system permease protein
LARARLAAYLIAALALAATLLAAVGIYGLVNYLVRRRRREIAVRAALGARPAQAAGLSTVRVLRFVAMGLAAGTLGGAAAARAWRTQFFEVSPFEPWAYLVAGAVVALIATVAVAIPAWRRRRWIRRRRCGDRPVGWAILPAAGFSAGWTR